MMNKINYQEQANKLLIEQKNNWPLLKGNLEGLKNAQLKTFQFEGFSINVQYNPKRITSSAAKVDKKTIQERKCFLCSANRPNEQKQVSFENDYEILCNPFPIFKEHYTIAHLNHTPQEINHSFDRFLDISKSLPELLTFYNAPNCGASAPDHLHFQAGNLGFVPMEKDFESIKSRYGKKIGNFPNLALTAINDGLRRFTVLESNDKSAVKKVFESIYKYIKEAEGGNEPMLNIVSWYKNEWCVIIFLREKHRPWQFFEEGEKNILLSPASVDLGGTMITPLEKDFNKITKEDVADILNQVSLNPDKFNDLCKYLTLI